MLSREELEKLKSSLGFNIWQIERDYLQHLFLLFFSRRISDELIFKGGTALQKAYGLNRFSIDLDFTKNKDWPEKLFMEIGKEITLFGFETKIKEIKKVDAFLIKLEIKGPLYKGTERTLTVLRIEISSREKVLLPPETREIFPLYSDLSPYLVKIMALEETLAEKVRAVLTRNKAGDIFDLRFLLNKKVRFNKELINEKLKPYGAPFSLKGLTEKIEAVGGIWDNELTQLTYPAPPFETVKREILQAISKIL
ncbi:nucleotidyl transferase AbiEii/AbiGii toxin family protein [Candidatus Woesearchaeota archaeon]|nr:nucleotidyl transferase AbiEii/AbiGii toxin family protein [Candidatus Woesearchaeota archaeon]